MNEIKAIVTEMMQYEKGVQEIEKTYRKKSSEHTRAKYSENNERMYELEGELNELGESLRNTRASAETAKQALLNALGIIPEKLEALYEPA